MEENENASLILKIKYFKKNSRGNHFRQKFDPKTGKF
jgi:aspartate oxidase